MTLLYTLTALVLVVLILLICYICLATKVILNFINEKHSQIQLLFESVMNKNNELSNNVDNVLRVVTTSTMSNGVKAHESLTRSEFIEKMLDRTHLLIMRFAIAKATENLDEEITIINQRVLIKIDYKSILSYCEDWLLERRIYPTMRFENQDAFKIYFFTALRDRFIEKQNIHSVRAYSTDLSETENWFEIEVEVNSEFFTPYEHKEFKIARILKKNSDNE